MIKHMCFDGITIQSEMSMLPPISYSPGNLVIAGQKIEAKSGDIITVHPNNQIELK